MRWNGTSSSHGAEAAGPPARKVIFFLLSRPAMERGERGPAEPRHTSLRKCCKAAFGMKAHVRTPFSPRQSLQLA